MSAWLPRTKITGGLLVAHLRLVLPMPISTHRSVTKFIRYAVYASLSAELRYDYCAPMPMIDHGSVSSMVLINALVSARAPRICW